MGYGKKIDETIGALSRFMHLRAARHNTVSDMGHYLDQQKQVLFPPTPSLYNPKIQRTMLDRLLNASTVSWISTHEVLCPRYRKRHHKNYKKNLTAWARWIRPDGAIRKDALIYVHGWLEPGSWAEEASLFRHWLRHLDVDIIHITLPFHGHRKPLTSIFRTLIILGMHLINLGIKLINLGIK